MFWLLAFIATIPAANWMVGNVGTVCIPNGPCLIPVAPGLMAPSGVLMIGLALVLAGMVEGEAGLALVGAYLLAGELAAGFPGAIVLLACGKSLCKDWWPLRRWISVAHRAAQKELSHRIAVTCKRMVLALL